jgi:hypothetical protein
MKVIADPSHVIVDNRIEFEYNGKVRSGKVERVGKTFLTIKHDDPASFNNKVYSTYQFKRISSKILAH